EAGDDAEFIVAPRAIDERVAFQLVSMMRDVVRRGTGRAALAIGREDLGGKTGSTNDYRDAWFVGFGGNLVTTVWVGRDDNRSLGRREYGGRAALPIWTGYMGVALEGQDPMPHEMPDGLVEVAVSASGRLLPQGAGGPAEYIKAEDLERMAAQIDDGFDDTMPAEEVYDIFRARAPRRVRYSRRHRRQGRTPCSAPASTPKTGPASAGSAWPTRRRG